MPIYVTLVLKCFCYVLQEAPEYKAIMETTEICEDGELFPLKDITPTLLSDSDGIVHQKILFLNTSLTT